MKEVTTKRDVFVEIIKNLCINLGVELSVYSQGWVLNISNDIKNGYVFGYSFSLNPDASSKICKDKTATSELLNQNNISNINHVIFHTYREFNTPNGNWEKMITFFNENNKKIVIKPNEGSSGKDVFVIDNQRDLELSLYRMFGKVPTICFSKFINIKNEYRIIVLDNQVHLVYKKIIPKIIGNGIKTILELLTEKYDEIPEGIIKYLFDKEISLNLILDKNEILKLNWMFNLSKGANISLEIDKVLKNKLELLSLKVAKLLGMIFTSIDIIEDENGELIVIEVNSGVMLISFALMGEKETQIANSIYKKAIELMLI